MSNITAVHRIALFRIKGGEFSSGDLGLTLISISLCVLVFVITPMREAGVSGRIAVDLLIMVLMVFAAVTVKQTRFDTFLVITMIFVTAALLGAASFIPNTASATAWQHIFNSYPAPLCPHRAAGDVSWRPDYLEPHPGWSECLSADWDGMGFDVSGYRAIPSRLVPIRHRTQGSGAN